MHIVAKEVRLHHRHRRGRRHDSVGLGRGVRSQGKKTRPHRRGFFGDGAGQVRTVSRVAQHRQPLAAAGDLRLREQRLRRVHAIIGAHQSRTVGARTRRPTEFRQARSTATICSRCATAMQKAVEKCRAGKGPVFVECLTHRMRGHYEGDPAKYRELAQLAEWKKQDPIARATRALKSKKAANGQRPEIDRS